MKHEIPKDGGGPAYPIRRSSSLEATGDRPRRVLVEDFDPGMTLRQRAAIDLRVPRSGLEWLDDMIRESQRIELAGQVLAATWLTRPGMYNHECALYALERADVMLAEQSTHPQGETNAPQG